LHAVEDFSASLAENTSLGCRGAAASFWRWCQI